MTFAARIRRVRMKDGADVHVLRNPMPDRWGDEMENNRGKIIEHARRIAGHSTDQASLDGFVVIGLFADGTASIGYRLPDRLPTCLVPSYIAEMLRRDAIIEPTAGRVVDRAFGWRE